MVPPDTQQTKQIRDHAATNKRETRKPIQRNKFSCEGCGCPSFLYKMPQKQAQWRSMKPNDEPISPLSLLSHEITSCRKCPRLVQWREKVAQEKAPRFSSENYWGQPVPGFGDENAWLLLVGLAPAAHGANRTGRSFTGDRSGDFLYAALHRNGFANQPSSTHRNDGLQLKNAYILSINRCAPPENKPTPQERDNCLLFAQQEISLLSNAKVFLALGKFAWDGMLRVFSSLGLSTKPATAFSHTSEMRVGPYVLLGCFHPSQQNTFTGKLTPHMMDARFSRAKELFVLASK